ncbi:ABC transporter substrate-binding protein [Sulfitobacter porphyrae]|uniref:ABC transporter substrate-binding protein n=1 Tax=Sulfitobacter porphyrae TaxID=1246864 RepID=A0ABW2B8D6_9RHOB
MTSDALSMDPQGQLSSSSFPYLRMGYEGLTVLTPELKPAPGLAESWERIEPTVWRFKLREGITFHEGQALSAEDVVFSIKRASEPDSAFKLFTRTIEDVAAIDDMTVEITTVKPDPLLLNNLASIFVMDSGWASENGIEPAKNYKNPQKYYSDQNMNGTGPFRLVNRKVDVSSEFERNADWWGNDSYPGNLDRVTILPIANAATRVAAMLSGELDLLTGVPIADAGRIEADDRFDLETAPQLRTIMFSFNHEVDKLMSGSIDSNPFKDARVRQAVSLAVDAKLIQDRIMRSYSVPTAILVPPGLAGYDAELAAPAPRIRTAPVNCLPKRDTRTVSTCVSIDRTIATPTMNRSARRRFRCCPRWASARR